MEEEKRELIRCRNRQKADIRFQDGALPYVVGAKNYQVVRADRSASAEVVTWTYNHAPMLAYWKQRYWIEYLSGPTGEHVPPSRTLLTSSADGINWTLPVTVFPPLTVDAGPYCGPGKELIEGDAISCVMHQRMGFYVSKAGRLLVLGFYGISPAPDIAPNNGYGLGRVVREVREDGSFSDIYYLKKNLYGGYGPEENRYFPEYEECSDEGLVHDCAELLSSWVIRQQWWEEERLDTGFFGCLGGKAISCYELPEGGIMGICKNSMATETDSGGNSWKPLEECPSVETATGKVWGQRTSDGKYALVYNPSTDSAHRWPLAVSIGEDGREFDGLYALTPEVTPCRYAGILKNLGPQYVRGVWGTYPQPEDGSMWLTYSVNKEDIWAACVPVPVRGRWTGRIDEVLDEAGSAAWNVYSPKWAPVTASRYGDEGVPCLCMEDREPYDRPLAIRIFEKAEKLKLSAEVMICENSEALRPSGLVMELQDSAGRTPVRLRFLQDGSLLVHGSGREERVGEYRTGRWLRITIEADCERHQYEVALAQEGNEVFRGKYYFSQSAADLERVLFTTKDSLPWNTLKDCGKYGDMGDLPDSERKTELTVCCIHSLRVEKCERGGTI